jgi:hypothetical protein
MSDDKDSLNSAFGLIDLMDNLNPEKKRDLRKNCEFAIRQFSEDWLDREESKIHPLRGFLGSSIGVSELGELGLAIRLLQSQENFPKIMERLRSPNQFYGAYSEVLVGYWLKNAGVNFNYLKPKKKSSSSDIRIHSAQRDLIFEITTKDYPEEYLKAHQIFSKFSNTLLFNKKGLSVCALNHRSLTSEHHADEILRTCEDLIEKAAVSGFEELHLKKIIDVYILRPENMERVPKRHRSFTFIMPKTDEYARIRGTIKEKARQLNQNVPGVVLIFDQHFWPLRHIGHFATKLRHELEEKIFEYPNLSALVLITQFGDTSLDKQNIIRENDSWIAMRTFDPKSIISKYKVVIWNKYATYPLNEDEREILKKI